VHSSSSERLMHFVRHFGWIYLLDVVVWIIAIVSAQVLRFDFDPSKINITSTLLLLGVTAVLQLVGGWIFWLYRGRFGVGSFDEVRALFFNTVAIMLVDVVVVFLLGFAGGIPRSTMIIASPIAFSLMGLTRYLVRLSSDRRLKPGASAERTIILGAGYVGTLTVQRLLTDAAADFIPVAMIDDDPLKQNYEVRGVRVLGGIGQLADVAKQTQATTIIVCIGFADASLLRRVNDIAKEAGIRVLVLPPIEKIFDDPSTFGDLREISIEDLIGRHPVRLDLDSIAKYLKDARVLVTGAGGSIGAELCRQLVEFAPAELIMLDRDETGLQQTQLSIHGHGLLDTRDVVLADIRDAQALGEIFEQRQPTVVFHAAALKHLPMLEQYPGEAWKTNVLGTLNVLEAAASVDVKTFVNISTDKAANPTSVLGHSKRVAEKLTAGMGEKTGKRYISVRFGNVIGSRGSMLPTFTSLIEAGGPLTITDPDVTRFFMTIPEACQLVIQAGGVGRPGEVLILDMGEPVRILDVAERMIEQSGKDIEIVFTGLRHGEKLHEELVGAGESGERPFHPKISHASVKSLSKSGLNEATWKARLGQ
jgi:FlaA1/EpsC-like NDP-sugar epimerase